VHHEGCYSAAISVFLILGDAIGPDIFGAFPVSTKYHGMLKLRFKKPTQIVFLVTAVPTEQRFGYSGSGLIIIPMMVAMVPPGMIVVTRPVVVIAVAVVVIGTAVVIVSRIIVGIVSRSEGKAETAIRLRRLRSDGCQPQSGEANRKEFFHIVISL